MLIVLKKIWVWLKAYWWIPAVLIIAVPILILTGSSPFGKLLEDAKKFRREEVNIINKENENAAQKKEEIRIKYKEIVSKLNEKYIEENKAIKFSEKKTIRKLLDECDDEEMARKMEEMFGIKYEGKIL